METGKKENQQSVSHLDLDEQSVVIPATQEIVQSLFYGEQPGDTGAGQPVQKTP